jgi:DNA-binding response OmpR family regulator
MALEARGYEVVTLESPLTLFRALQEHTPDLVLLDVSMPALDGDKAAQLVRRSGAARCPIVFLSDRPRAELAALSASSGAAGHIVKTNDLRSLADQVDAFLQD